MVGSTTRYSEIYEKIQHILKCYVSEISKEFDNQTNKEDYRSKRIYFRGCAINLSTSCSTLNKKLKSVPDSRKKGIYNLAMKSWQRIVFNSLKTQLTNGIQRMPTVILCCFPLTLTSLVHLIAARTLMFKPMLSSPS